LFKNKSVKKHVIYRVSLCLDILNHTEKVAILNAVKTFSMLR